MTDPGPWLIRWSRVDGVAVVEIATRELVGPDAAQHLGEQLDTLLRAGERRLILDFAAAQTVTSTVYAALLNFRKRVAEAGGELRLCAMTPAVRFGADILSLGRFIPIDDDAASALASFRHPSPSTRESEAAMPPASG